MPFLHLQKSCCSLSRPYCHHLPIHWHRSAQILQALCRIHQGALLLKLSCQGTSAHPLGRRSPALSLSQQVGHRLCCSRSRHKRWYPYYRSNIQVYQDLLQAALVLSLRPCHYYTPVCRLHQCSLYCMRCTVSAGSSWANQGKNSSCGRMLFHLETCSQAQV